MQGASVDGLHDEEPFAILGGMLQHVDVKKFFCFFHAAYPCLRQSVAVAVIRCLRHAPLGHAASSCWLLHSTLCSLHGVQTLPGHRLFLFFVFSAAFFSFRGLLSLDDKAAYTAVYDRYSSQSGTTFLFFARSADNWLLRMFSPLGDVFVSAPVELSLTFLRLLVLRLGLNSHSHKH